VEVGEESIDACASVLSDRLCCKGQSSGANWHLGRQRDLRTTLLISEAIAFYIYHPDHASDASTPMLQMGITRISSLKTASNSFPHKRGASKAMQPSARISGKRSGIFQRE
jgi:hypothetical protein